MERKASAHRTETTVDEARQDSEERASREDQNLTADNADQTDFH